MAYRSTDRPSSMTRGYNWRMCAPVFHRFERRRTVRKEAKSLAANEQNGKNSFKAGQVQRFKPSIGDCQLTSASATRIDRGLLRVPSRLGSRLVTSQFSPGIFRVFTLHRQRIYTFRNLGWTRSATFFF